MEAPLFVFGFQIGAPPVELAEGRPASVDPGEGERHPDSRRKHGPSGRSRFVTCRPPLRSPMRPM